MGAYKEKFIAQNLKIDNLMLINEDRRYDYSGAEQLKDVLEDVQRLHTFVFRYPEHRHYYLAFTNEEFGDFVCHWIGIVNYCYILHCHSRTSMMTPFCESDVLICSGTVMRRLVGAQLGSEIF